MKIVAFFKKMFKKTDPAPPNESSAPQDYSYISPISEEYLRKESQKLAELERKIAAGEIKVKTTGPEPFDFDYDATSM